MKKNKLLSLLLAGCLIINAFLQNVALAAKPGDSLFFEDFTLINPNEKTRMTLDEEPGSLNVVIVRGNERTATASIQLIRNSIVYTNSIVGEFDEIKLDDGTGYIYYFEDYISADILNALTNSHFTSDTKCVFDITTHSNGDSIVTVTIGCANKNYKPIILEFGYASQSIGKVTLTYLNENLYLAPDIEYDSSSVLPCATIDSAVRECGAGDFYGGSYSVGAMWVYHALQINNSGSTPYALRLCSNSNTFKTFLKNEYGFNSVTQAVVDNVKMSVSYPGNRGLNFITNSQLPQNSQKNVNIPFVAIIAGNLISFAIPITTSSTSLSVSDEKVDWVMRKTNGWANSVTDGDITSNSGLAVYTDLRGNISTSVQNVPVYGIGSMCYKYVAYKSDAPTIMNMWFDDLEIRTSISIVNQ